MAAQPHDLTISSYLIFCNCLGATCGNLPEKFGSKLPAYLRLGTSRVQGNPARSVEGTGPRQASTRKYGQRGKIGLRQRAALLPRAQPREPNIQRFSLEGFYRATGTGCVQWQRRPGPIRHHQKNRFRCLDTTVRASRDPPPRQMPIGDAAILPIDEVIQMRYGWYMNKVQRALNPTCAHGHTDFRILKSGRRQCILCNRVNVANFHARKKPMEKSK